MDHDAMTIAAAAIIAAICTHIAVISATIAALTDLSNRAWSPLVTFWLLPCLHAACLQHSHHNLPHLSWVEGAIANS